MLSKPRKRTFSSTKAPYSTTNDRHSRSIPYNEQIFHPKPVNDFTCNHIKPKQYKLHNMEYSPLCENQSDNLYIATQTVKKQRYHSHYQSTSVHQLSTNKSHKRNSHKIVQVFPFHQLTELYRSNGDEISLQYCTHILETNSSSTIKSYNRMAEHGSPRIHGFPVIHTLQSLCIDYPPLALPFPSVSNQPISNLILPPFPLIVKYVFAVCKLYHASTLTAINAIESIKYCILKHLRENNSDYIIVTEQEILASMIMSSKLYDIRSFRITMSGVFRMPIPRPLHSSSSILPTRAISKSLDRPHSSHVHHPTTPKWLQVNIIPGIPLTTLRQRQQYYTRSKSNPSSPPSHSYLLSQGILPNEMHFLRELSTSFDRSSLAKSEMKLITILNHNGIHIHRTWIAYIPLLTKMALHHLTVADMKLLYQFIILNCFEVGMALLQITHFEDSYRLSPGQLACGILCFVLKEMQRYHTSFTPQFTASELQDTEDFLHTILTPKPTAMQWGYCVQFVTQASKLIIFRPFTPKEWTSAYLPRSSPLIPLVMGATLPSDVVYYPIPQKQAIEAAVSSLLATIQHRKTSLLES